jgi:hypothetical protein
LASQFSNAFLSCTFVRKLAGGAISVLYGSWQAAYSALRLSSVAA